MQTYYNTSSRYYEQMPGLKQHEGTMVASKEHQLLLEILWVLTLH